MNLSRIINNKRSLQEQINHNHKKGGGGVLLVVVAPLYYWRVAGQSKTYANINYFSPFVSDLCCTTPLKMSIF